MSNQDFENVKDILYLEGVTFEKPELETKIESKFPGGPQVSQFVTLTGQLLEGRLNGANGSGSVHLHCDTIRPAKKSQNLVVMNNQQK